MVCSNLAQIAQVAIFIPYLLVQRRTIMIKLSTPFHPLFTFLFGCCFCGIQRFFLCGSDYTEKTPGKPDWKGEETGKEKSAIKSKRDARKSRIAVFR
jgi:hypothetical protein